MDSSGIGLLMGKIYRALGMRKRLYSGSRRKRSYRAFAASVRTSSLHCDPESRELGSVMREDTNEVSANEMLLIFESNPVNEGLARVTAASFCTQLNPTLEESQI